MGDSELKANGFALLRNGVRDARNDFHGAAAPDITMAGYVSVVVAAKPLQSFLASQP